MPTSAATNAYNQCNNTEHKHSALRKQSCWSLCIWLLWRTDIPLQLFARMANLVGNPWFYYINTNLKSCQDNDKSLVFIPAIDYNYGWHFDHEYQFLTISYTKTVKICCYQRRFCSQKWPKCVCDWGSTPDPAGVLLCSPISPSWSSPLPTSSMSSASRVSLPWLSALSVPQHAAPVLFITSRCLWIHHHKTTSTSMRQKQTPMMLFLALPISARTQIQNITVISASDGDRELHGIM